MQMNLAKSFERSAEDSVSSELQNVTSPLEHFAGALDQAFVLPKEQLKATRNDFTRGIDKLLSYGMPFADILCRLDPKRLDGFYAHTPQTFFPLDNGAKQFPLTMRQGKMAMFRIAATLTEPVEPSILQLALTFVLRRFPHYATRMRRGVFWYYLQPHTARYTVSRENEEVCKAIERFDDDHQLFRVMYAGKRVSVEVFHILSDGIGGLTFLKSLLAEYYRLLGEDLAEEDEQILDVSAPTLAADIENGFSRFRSRESGERLIGSPAVQIPGECLPGGGCRTEQFVFSAAELLHTARAFDVSVTILMSAVIMTACRQTVQAGTGQYKLQIPINLRRMFACNTLRNFSWFSSLFSEASAAPSPKELAADLSRQLKVLTTKDALERSISMAQRTIRLLRYIPLQWKSLFMRTAYQMTGEFYFTTTLSNLGVINLPHPLKSHVIEIAATLVPSFPNTYNFGLSTVQDCALLNVTRTTKDTTLMNRLVEAAHAYGLTITKRG